MPRHPAGPSEVVGPPSRAARGGRLYFEVPTREQLAAVPLPLLQRAVLAGRALLDRLVRADENKKVREIETAIVEALSDEWNGRIPDALKAALKALAEADPDGTTTEADLERIIAAARGHMVDGWEKAISEPVEFGVEKAYGHGRVDTLKPLQMAVDWNLVDEHARGVLQKDTLYWVGGAWDHQLGGAIADTIRKEVIEKGLGRREAGEALKALLGERFPERSDHYWRIVAAAGVVRSRTFGVVGSFEQAEVVEYRYRAIMDARTCEICELVNGRVFSVASAVKQRDDFLAAESPEEAKAIHPWVKLADVEGKDTAEMEAAGILQPPIHGLCRCVLVMHRFRGE